MTVDARDVSRSIARPFEEVVAFAGEPANLPQWAAGLSVGIRLERGRWITDSPMGEVEVRFVGSTGDGILDHDVVFPDGTVNANPLRVYRTDAGADVIFTVLRRPGMTDEDLVRDVDLVRADLERLREVLEDGT